LSREGELLERAVDCCVVSLFLLCECFIVALPVMVCFTEMDSGVDVRLLTGNFDCRPCLVLSELELSVESLFGGGVGGIGLDVMVCLQLDGAFNLVMSRRLSASGGVSCKKKAQIQENSFTQCCA
jgi:hypothetical protein